MQRQHQEHDAEPMQRGALHIDQQTYGAVHPQLGIGLNNLVMLLLNLGQPGQAELIQVQALKVTTEALGPDHRNVRICKDNLDLIRKRKNG
jgi:hypothetical protein